MEEQLNDIKQRLLSELEILYLEQEQLKFNQSITKEQLDLTQNNIDKLKHQLDKISNVPQVHIKLSDYFSEQEIKEYTEEPNMLFESNMMFKDWIDWFFEEVPFIQNKYLNFTGSMTKKSYNLMDIPHNCLVKANPYSGTIEVMSGEPIIISVDSINLYKTLQNYL